MLGLGGGTGRAAGALGPAFRAGAIVAGAVAVLVIGYAQRPELRSDRDATTPMAALATVALGFLAGIGEPGFAIAGAAVVT